MIDRRLAVLIPGLLAGATGCMRIYPDPELPDVIVEWPMDCGDDGVTVRLEAVAADGTLISRDATCGAGQVRIEDLERARYTINASLLDASGGVLGRSYPSDVDLTKGLSRRTYVYEFVRDRSFYRVAWTFNGGDTCQTLGATTILVSLRNDDSQADGRVPCDSDIVDYFAPVAAGTYTLQLFAQRDDDAAVAASERRTNVVIPDHGASVDFGTIALARCTPICEVPPPPEPREPDGPGEPDRPSEPDDHDGP
jgi:hypothetical protein